jgi:bifunctional non-homologous end joining protein LigD
MFQSEGITKDDIVEYYTEIAEAMVPHLKSRPLTLWRHPRGIGQKGFVQQDFGDSLPDWVDRVKVDKADGTLVHPTADRRDALRWLANQNCIIVHSGLSKRDRLHQPDRIVFDLNPSTSDFAVVKATAWAFAGVLDDIGLASYVQTTGSRGLHVVTPIKVDADYDTVRQFAREVADVVAADDPDHRTVEVRKAKRGDRVYLDVMRNAYAQTAVAPYSVRAREGVPVATPLEWDELRRRGLRRRGRSLTRAAQRLAKMNA